MSCRRRNKTETETEAKNKTVRAQFRPTRCDRPPNRISERARFVRARGPIGLHQSSGRLDKGSRSIASGRPFGELVWQLFFACAQAAQTKVDSVAIGGARNRSIGADNYSNFPLANPPASPPAPSPAHSRLAPSSKRRFREGAHLTKSDCAAAAGRLLHKRAATRDRRAR